MKIKDIIAGTKHRRSRDNRKWRVKQSDDLVKVNVSDLKGSDIGA